MSLPRADILKKVGDEAFPIYCHLNPRHSLYKTEGIRAKDLKFFAQYAVDDADHEVRF